MVNISLIDNIFTDCTESSYLFNKVKVFFTINNYNIISDLSKSNYIIINTCGVFSDIEKKFLDYIDDLYLMYWKKSKIIIFWCLPGISNNLINDSRWLIMIPSKKESLFNDYFEHKINIEDVSWISINENNIEYPWEIFNIENKKYFLHIARWCIHKCSYCAIKKTIWYVKSEPLDKLIKEFNIAIDNWYNEIVLVSDDVWSYGIDIWISFDLLFNELCENKWDYLIDINYVEPSTFLNIFPKIKKNFYKVSVLTIPVQSFSDRLLILMKREYDIKSYLNLISDIRKYWNNDLKIINHIIFWYPSETDSEFKSNIKYIELFDNTLFTLYSYRKWTKLFNKEELISYSNKKNRLIILVKLNKIYWDLVHLANLN